MIASEVTDFPDPDSPTTAMDSPAARSNDKPRTALTGPASLGNVTCRSRTDSTVPEVVCLTLPARAGAAAVIEPSLRTPNWGQGHPAGRPRPRSRRALKGPRRLQAR